MLNNIQLDSNEVVYNVGWGKANLTNILVKEEEEEELVVSQHRHDGIHIKFG